MSSPIRVSKARPASIPAPLLLCSAVLFAIVAACGSSGGGDGITEPPPLVNTGPGNTGTPDVSGFYMRVNNAAASTCSPQTLPAGGGTVKLEAFVDSEPIRLYQNGTKIQLAYLNFPDKAADTGTVDLSGKLSMGIVGIGSKENLRASTRQFYVDLTGSFQLTRPNTTSPLAGPGNFTYVYREDSPTAPTYTTCTRTIDINFRKNG